MLDFVSELTRQVTREENTWSLCFYRSRGLLSFFLLFILFVFMPLHSRVCIFFFSSFWFLLSTCSFSLFLCAMFSVFQQRFFFTSSFLPLSFSYLSEFLPSLYFLFRISFVVTLRPHFLREEKNGLFHVIPPPSPAEVNTTFGGFTTGPWFEPVHILTTC